jgi:prepilin-type N-terminal cleavage/methylation domain-containing protein
MTSTPARTVRRGFTLVELLVVIGIIALLISILLPTLSRARDSGRAAACGANNRSIVQAMFLYQAENQLSLPWGRVYTRDDGGRQIWNPDGAGEQSFTIAPTSLTAMTEDTEYGASLYFSAPAGVPNFPRDAIGEMFRCAQVGSGAENGVTHYGLNPIAMPDANAEVRGFPSQNFGTGGTNDTSVVKGRNPITGGSFPRPAKAGQLFPDNALVWDAPVYFEMDDPYLFYYSYWMSFVDAPGISGNYPSYGTSYGQISRYRGSEDLLQDNALEGDSYSVFYLAPGEVTTLAGYDVADLHNTDIISVNGRSLVFLWGNLRFRHQQESQTMVGFADGSVQGLRVSPDVPLGNDPGNVRYCETEFKRAFYRIKAPSKVDWAQGA